MNPTIENISFDTLLHYVKKDELSRLLSDEELRQIEMDASQEGKKLSKGGMKDWISLQDVEWQNRFDEMLRQSDVGRAAFERYAKTVVRLRNPGPDVAAKRIVAAQARKGFLGCIATKVDPFDFEDCVENCDNPKYADVELVPDSLKLTAYVKAGLAPPRLDDPGHISFLPRGLKEYIVKHPEDYEEYMEERKAEVEFLKTVRRNALRDNRRRLEEESDAKRKR